MSSPVPGLVLNEYCEAAWTPAAGHPPLSAPSRSFVLAISGHRSDSPRTLSLAAVGPGRL